MLLAEACDWAEGIGQSVVQLSVTASNERAIRSLIDEQMPWLHIDSPSGLSAYFGHEAGRRIKNMGRS